MLRRPPRSTLFPYRRSSDLRSEDAPLDQPTTSGRTLEDEFEGELHLPAPLLINVAGKIASVVDVTIWRRPIDAIEHVISREPELHVERFADCTDREVLEERSIPVKLRSSTENVATQTANVRTTRIARENSRLRAPECSAIEFETLRLLSRRWIRIPN